MKIILASIFLFLNSFIFSQVNSGKEIKMSKEKLELARSTKDLGITIPINSSIISTSFSFMLKGKLHSIEKYKDEIPYELKGVKKGKIYIDIKFKGADDKIWAETTVIKIE
jgi:hypothetical protein